MCTFILRTGHGGAWLSASAHRDGERRVVVHRDGPLLHGVERNRARPARPAQARKSTRVWGCPLPPPPQGGPPPPPGGRGRSRAGAEGAACGMSWRAVGLPRAPHERAPRVSERAGCRAVRSACGAEGRNCAHGAGRKRWKRCRKTTAISGAAANFTSAGDGASPSCACPPY